MRASFLSVGVGALLFAACGGATQSDLFTSPDDGGGAADSSQNKDSSGGDASMPEKDSSPGRDSSPGIDSSEPDASSNDPGIKCEGVGYCNAATQVCCRRGTQGTYTYDCTTASVCANAGGITLAIECDDQQDCNTQGKRNDVCCVTASGTGDATSVTCRPPTECSGSSTTWVCDISDPNSCPAGRMCMPSQQTLPGYDICL
jgi:hypothetical protein